jgi:hypothetical protein
MIQRQTEAKGFIFYVLFIIVFEIIIIGVVHFRNEVNFMIGGNIEGNATCITARKLLAHTVIALQSGAETIQSVTGVRYV